jgi:peroxiredoxin
MHNIGKTLFALTLATLLIVGCTKKEDSNKPSGSPAPRFSLKNLQGNTIRLADLKGKVVLLNFFATWCAPCREEIPDLVRLYNKFKDKGFEIVGIGLDIDGAAALGPFAKQFRIPYPILLGTREVVMDYGEIKGVPTSFFIDRNGYIAEQFIGVRPAHVLEKTIAELLEQKV